MATASPSCTLQKRMRMASTTNVEGCQKWPMILMVVRFGKNRNVAVTLEWADFSIVQYM
jgi:hypothetical protein